MTLINHGIEILEIKNSIWDNAYKFQNGNMTKKRFLKALGKDLQKLEWVIVE